MSSEYNAIEEFEEPVIVKENTIPPVVLTLIRYGLTVAGGFLVNDGLMDAETMETAVGALLVLIPTIWGAVLAKRNRELAVHLAKELPDSKAQVR